MKKLTFTIVMFMLACFGIVEAQQGSQHPKVVSQKQGHIHHFTGERCGNSVIADFMEDMHPGYKQELNNFEQVVQYYASQSTSGSKSLAPILTIPVVVHVIHLSSEAVGTGRNLNAARVQAQIAILNRDFMSQNPNYTSGTPAVFQAARGIPEIQFCLATKDPQGNNTTGITRNVFTDPASTNDIENTIKPATSWDATKYLNIWTLAIPGTSQFGGTLGYAYLPTPGLVGTDIDGIVIDYRWFGSPSISGVSGDCRSLTHEAGHYFGLNHIWGDSDGGTSPHVCTDSDGISDTPNQLGPTADNTSFSCASGTIPTSCSGVQSMFCDYMDYTDDDACYTMFTTGQVNVMRNVLQGTPTTLNGVVYTGRASLLSSQSIACAPQSQLDAGISAHITPANGSSVCNTAAITPQVTLKNYGSTTLTSATIRYQVNGGAAVNFSWSGSLTTNATTNITLAPFTPPVGVFTFKSFTVSPNGGTDQNTANDTTTTIHQTSPQALPFSEDFSGTMFNPTIKGLRVTQPTVDTWTWTRATASANGVGTGSAVMDNYATDGSTNSNPLTTLDRLVTPVFNFTNVANATLTFDVAYARWTNTAGTSFANDSLKVQVSTDCGNTFGTPIYIDGGATLATAPATGNAFVPTATQWAHKTVSLSAYNNSANVTVALVSKSDWGNYLYLDNINISSGCNLATQMSSTISSSCSACNGTATVTPSGGSNYTYLWNTGATTQTITGKCAGAYTVTVSSTGGCTTTASVTVTNSGTLTLTTTGNATTCGQNNGSAGVGATGGTTYTYLWSNGGTTTSITGLAAGNYNVTVTSNGCTATATRNVATSTGITVTTTGNATTCGQSNGSAGVGATGGTTYTYLWSNGGTTTSITGLAAGNYNVTVTSNGCTATATRNVATSTGITVTTTGNATTCGQNNGSAGVGATGGTNYTYLWSNGGTTTSITGLAAGNYNVTVTSNGCAATATRNVATSTGITATVSTTQETCNANGVGLSNGTATATPTGGTTPYTYAWSNGQTTQTATGMPTGGFVVTVTSANGCSFITQGAVTLNCNTSTCTWQIGASATPSSCGLCNGAATVVLTPSATTGVSYLWSNGSTSTSVTGLCGGVYTVTASQIGTTCTRVASVTVTTSSGISATVSTTQETCNANGVGLSNGTATATPTGGTTPYTYAWSNGQTTQTATGMPTGGFVVTVTSANGCSFITQGAVTLNCNTSTCTWQIGASATPSSCGLCNGAATVTLTPPTTTGVSYLWSNGSTSTSVTGLCGGVYTVTASQIGTTCTSVASVTVSTSSGITATVSTTQETCNANGVGLSNGTATATPTGGTTPYTYVWSNGQTAQTATGMPTGGFVVTVTSANGCSFITQGAVTLNCNTSTCTWQIGASATPSSCGLCNGAATVVLTPSATTGVSYLWSNGSTSTSVTGLCGGVYTVTASQIGTTCTRVASVTVTTSSGISATVSTTQETCNANGVGLSNGTATATPTGGTTPYTYAWSNGQTTQTATGMPTGGFVVTVTSANGCSFITQGAVTLNCNTNPCGLQLSATGVATTCGLCNGSATATSNAVTPMYLWSNGATTASLTGLCPGTYSVTVADISVTGVICTATASASVSQSAGLNISTSSISETCNSNMQPLANGSATATVGNSATFVWSNGQTGQSATGLSAGTYTVTATNNSGCTATASATVIFNCNCNMQVSLNHTNATCSNSCNGSITATASIAGATFLWSNGSTSNPATGLCAGNYTVTAAFVGASGLVCTATASTVITAPSPVIASTTNTSVPCSIAGGTANAAAIGGASPYTFVWSNGQTTIGASGLAAGLHTVTATDSNGCTAAANITIPPVQSAPTVVPTVTPVSCFNGNNGAVSLAVSGGTGPYTFQWFSPLNTTTQNVTGLAGGNYNVGVTGANGCQTIISVFVATPSQLNLGFSTTFANLGNNGTATCNPTGGTPAYTYQWSNGQTTQTSTGLTPGVYNVIVTDANGCQRTGTIQVAGNFIDVHELPDMMYFNLTPNPTNDLITLNTEFSQETDLSVRIFSINGALLQTQQLSGRQIVHSFDLSGYASGTYILQFVSEHGVMTEKVIKN